MRWSWQLLKGHLLWPLTYCGDAREKFKIFPSTSCSFWKCCETFGSRCFKIGKLILPSICFQAILSPLDRSCLSYEIFKSIESCKLNKTTYNSPQIIKWTDTAQLQKSKKDEDKNRKHRKNCKCTFWLSVTNPQCHDFIFFNLSLIHWIAPSNVFVFFFVSNVTCDYVSSGVFWRRWNQNVS